jgi:hypothetical protein
MARTLEQLKERYIGSPNMQGPKRPMMGGGRRGGGPGVRMGGKPKEILPECAVFMAKTGKHLVSLFESFKK